MFEKIGSELHPNGQRVCYLVVELVTHPSLGPKDLSCSFLPYSSQCAILQASTDFVAQVLIVYHPSNPAQNQTPQQQQQQEKHIGTIRYQLLVRVPCRTWCHMPSCLVCPRDTPYPPTGVKSGTIHNDGTSTKNAPFQQCTPPSPPLRQQQDLMTHDRHSALFVSPAA